MRQKNTSANAEAILSDIRRQSPYIRDAGHFLLRMLQGCHTIEPAKLNGIEVLDHVIVGEDGFHSFAESGQMDLLSSKYLAGLKELRELSAEEFNTRYSFEAHELDLNNELSI